MCVLCPQTYEEEELLRLVYFGGVEASLRKEVWPFLLGHYQFGMSEDKRNEVLLPPLLQLLPAPPAEVLTLEPSPAGGPGGQSVLPADHERVAQLRGDCASAGEGAARRSLGQVLVWRQHGQFQSEDYPP